MARTVDGEKLAEWRRRFARYRTSGLTVAEFCRREGVAAGRWKYWQQQAERLTASEPRRPVSRTVFQAVEIIPRRAVVVRFPGGATLEIPDDRIDLVRLAIDRMAILPEADAC
jgi:transposase-like protein